jgi:hypothetical protein
MSGDELYCDACAERIRPNEPYVSLVDFEATMRLEFHRRCAYAAACIAADNPRVYDFVYHPLAPELN